LSPLKPTVQSRRGVALMLMHEFQFEYFRGFVTFLLPYSKQPK
jgi:hypothetical protein